MYSLFKFFFRLGDYYRGLKIFLLINLCGGICKGIPKVGKNVIFKYPPHKGIKFGKKCDIGSFVQFDIPPGGVLEIGDNLKLTNTINIAVSNKVRIGNNVLIAEGVSIRDSQHNYLNSEELISQQGLEIGEIEIKDDVWIGKNSMILLNTVIHKGCVIGASSIVKSKTTDNYGVYAGLPLKKIKERTSR